MKRIHYVSACAGSGKTTAALKAVKHGIERSGLRFILAQPTKALVHSTLGRARQIYPDVQWRSITGDEHPGSVRSEFSKAIRGERENAIITTHAALLACGEIAGRGDWNLIVDEIPPVDFTFTANLSITWDFWTSLLDVTENSACDSVLDVNVKSECRELAERYAFNEPGDDVIKVTQPLWEKLINPHWKTVLTRSAWQTAGFQGTAQLQAHSWLGPTVFDGWGRVSIMGANFERSLIYAIWNNLGVECTEDPLIKVRTRKHDENTGKRCRIMYFTERDWSKTLRDKVGIDRVIEGLRDHVPGEHIWVANNDVEDGCWKIDKGTRISAIAHGLNEYRHHRCAVFLAALNDTPAHFSWMRKQWGIEPLELSRAKAQEAAYQMIMRTNLREPEGKGEVSVIVPDRRTANYLCELLPGSKQSFLDLGIHELGGSKRTLACGAPAKTSAERVREQRARDAARKKALSTLGTIMREAHGVTNEAKTPIRLSFEDSVYSRNIADHTFDNWDEFRDMLKSVWSVTLKDKSQGLLMNGGLFAMDTEAETVKGLDNFVYARLLQLDFDDSNLDPALTTRVLQDVRHIIYNSYNNGRDGKYRYRVVIPLFRPVTADLYECFWDIIARRIEDAGYSVGKLVRMKPDSGLDISKRSPVSWLYLPCQATRKNQSFWLENWQAPLLDPAVWVDRIPTQVPDYVETAVVDNRSEAVKDMVLALEGAAVSNAEAEVRKKRTYDAALEEWRNTTAGSGNKEFFRFAVRLRAGGFDQTEIRQLLRQHHADSHSNAADRRKQIPSILNSLQRRRWSEA